MSQQSTDAPHNQHLPSTLRTELGLKGKDHEDGREIDMVGNAMLIERIYQCLNTTPRKLADFCEKWQIQELALFGSVLRDDFRQGGEDPSDIDILYTYRPQARYGFEVFEMKEELEVLFGRKVDFVSKNAVKKSRNWLRRKTILQSAQVIYAKRSAIPH
ncbi:nucleotidyltransferase domain-containing protein [Spirulina sp. CCNP1310]|uniref:nucleotidyltransferase family protein n=1 Tax=Spirulina sp. CCNP1310 TaxID=3110249 RepID=UPI002B210BB3|nr:nucleotidyltransferase domain-containing protein [Spirulina sp. CCNP1310]MEA5421523.1 nucleotidyltransferase domain-containing protein [Spirulina sp. CCNP1310]